MCPKQYVGSASTKFRIRFNNYKSCWTKHLKGCQVPQNSFHTHFSQNGHNGQSDWEIILIDHTDDKLALREKEEMWIEKLNTYVPHALNKREVVVPFR